MRADKRKADCWVWDESKHVTLGGKISGLGMKADTWIGVGSRLIASGIKENTWFGTASKHVSQKWKQALGEGKHVTWCAKQTVDPGIRGNTWLRMESNRASQRWKQTHNTGWKADWDKAHTSRHGIANESRYVDWEAKGDLLDTFNLVIADGNSLWGNKNRYFNLSDSKMR